MDTVGEWLNQLSPEAYQKAAVEIQKMRIAQQPHLNIPKPDVPVVQQSNKLAVIRSEIRSMQPVNTSPQVARPELKVNALKAPAGANVKTPMLKMAGFLLTPIFAIAGAFTGGVTRGVSGEYKKFVGSRPPLFPR